MMRRFMALGVVVIGLAATTVKGYDIFQDAFNELVGALRRDAAREEASHAAGELISQGAQT